MAPQPPPTAAVRAPLQSDESNNLLRRLDLTSGVVTTVAGGLTKGFADGQRSAATFSGPTGVAMDAAGTFVIVVRQNVEGGAGWGVGTVNEWGEGVNQNDLSSCPPLFPTAPLRCRLTLVTTFCAVSTFHKGS